MIKFKKLKCILGLHEWWVDICYKTVNGKSIVERKVFCRECPKVKESKYETDTNQSS